MVSIIPAWERSLLAIRALVLLGRHFFSSLSPSFVTCVNYSSTYYTTTIYYYLLRYTASKPTIFFYLPTNHNTTPHYQHAFRRKLQLPSLPWTSSQGPSASFAKINPPISNDRDDSGAYPGLAGIAPTTSGRAFPSAWI
jgi:hypothetical protein